LVKEWVGVLKDSGVQDGITVNEITQFRKGRYEDADPAIQRKWCHVMLHFLPCVCSSYHKWEIKKSTRISQVTHATDEALVTWFLICYISDWDKLYEDTLQVQDTDQPNKRRRKEGKHKSNEELGKYMDLHASINQARKEQVETGWEEAIMEEARLQVERNQNITLQDSMPNAPSANQQLAKKTYVMMLSEDEDDEMPSMVGNATNCTDV
jgi:hypothetical protein